MMVNRVTQSPPTCVGREWENSIQLTFPICALRVKMGRPKTDHTAEEEASREGFLEEVALTWKPEG